jgi:hypothetical protein
MTARKLHQAARRSREIASLKDKHLYTNEPKVMRRRVYPDSEKAALRLDCGHDVPDTEFLKHYFPTELKLEIEFGSKLRIGDPDFVGFDV